MALHNAVDDDDEGTRRPANLHPAAAQQRNQKARNDGGEQTRLRAQTGGNGKGHGQGQGHHADGQPRAHIFEKTGAGVALQGVEKLGSENHQTTIYLCGGLLFDPD